MTRRTLPAVVQAAVDTARQADERRLAMRQAQNGRWRAQEPKTPEKPSQTPAQAEQAFLGASELRLSEKRFQQQVVALAKLLGWRTYHTFDSRRSASGFPDLVLIRRPHVLFIELKSQRGIVSEDQAAWIAELQACGLTAMIARPSDWAEIERVLGVRG